MSVATPMRSEFSALHVSMFRWVVSDGILFGPHSDGFTLLPYECDSGCERMYFSCRDANYIYMHLQVRKICI